MIHIRFTLLLLIALIGGLECWHSTLHAQQIVGITLRQDRDTTILMPRCEGDCPPDVLNRYLFEWDLGDCSRAFGNVVRHVYTQAPTEAIRLAALSIYDEDEDPDLVPVIIDDPVVVPLPPSSFRMRAAFSRPPVPGDRIQVAITLDASFAADTLMGELTVRESSRLLESAEWDTTALSACGRYVFSDIRTADAKVAFDSLRNLQDGPTTLLLTYDVPADLEVGEDSVRFRIHFKGVGAGSPIDQVVDLAAVVKGSHDPNYKAADPPEYFLPGQPITYTIHFQNIGTGPAAQIVISDFLDSLFDIHSVEVLRTEIAGKPYIFEAEIIDRQLIFSAKGERKPGGGGKRKRTAILPHSAIDEAGSQGLIEFRVYTRDTIGCFAHIANAAAIVFDNNPAIVTRCVVHKRFCDCQEYCQYLAQNGPPPLGLQEPTRPSGNTVPVTQRGSGVQPEQVKPEPIGQPGAAEPGAPGTELPLDGKTIALIVAGLLLLLLLLRRRPN